MSPLEQLRADQHDDLVLPADHAWDAFMAEVSPIRALADREPTTDIERRHLARTRRTA
jgi:hypothetical protein